MKSLFAFLQLLKNNSFVLSIFNEERAFSRKTLNNLLQQLICKGYNKAKLPHPICACIYHIA